jgi:signal transduction histidine kinase
LWFPNVHALAVFDPAQMQRNAPDRVYRPVIEETIVDGIKKMPDADGALRVKSTTKSIEFHYASPTLQLPDQNRFSYRLRGLNTAWTEASPSRLANFAHLPVGQYEFEVRVSRPDGMWQSVFQPLPVNVIPLLWERTSVQIVGLFGLLVFVTLVVWSVSRARMRRRLAVVERQRALEQERSRIARDMHDEIGARLTQISLLSAIAAGTAGNENELRAQTTKISSAAHSLTRSLDEIVWAVRPQNDNLESLVEYLDESLRDLCENSPVRYWFSGPASVPAVEVSANVRHNILLACSEAVNNTLKHAGATEVRVGLRLRPLRLEIEITDNGQGFDVAKGEAKRSGLTHIRQRIHDIGGHCECRSIPDEGTHFTFSIPMSIGVEDVST